MEHLTPEQLDTIRKKLEAKKADLVEQLSRIATKDPDIKGNWKATYRDIGDDWDDNVHEVAEHVVNLSLEQSLELHLKKVKSALERLDAGTYGTCETGGEDIPVERLMAYPETTRCQEHNQS